MGNSKEDDLKQLAAARDIMDRHDQALSALADSDEVRARAIFGDRYEVVQARLEKYKVAYRKLADSMPSNPRRSDF